MGRFAVRVLRRLWFARATLVCSLVALIGVPLAILAQDPCKEGQARRAAATPPSQIEGASTHVYKSINGIDLRLHIFTPPHHRPSDKRPGIVFFFGGGWMFGTVEQFIPQSKHLAGRGMVAIVADYRVRCRHNSTPFESLADAASAVRWLRIHAGQFGIDPARIAAGGGSAGGHLALSLGVFEKDDGKPSALVLFNPAVDLAKGQAVQQWISDNFGAAILRRAEEISPLQHLHNSLPPTIILNGKEDTSTTYAAAEQFCSRAKTMGNNCQVVGYERAQHGFFNPGVENGKWYRLTLLEADRFLTRIGYLPSPAPTEIP